MEVIERRYRDDVKRIRIGNVEIVPEAVPHDRGYISAVTTWHHAPDGADAASRRHEWREPLFDSPIAAEQFAWRRAVVMARVLQGFRHDTLPKSGQPGVSNGLNPFAPRMARN